MDRVVTAAPSEAGSTGRALDGPPRDRRFRVTVLDGGSTGGTDDAACMHGAAAVIVLRRDRPPWVSPSVRGGRTNGTSSASDQKHR
jgi:hypothetical protein